MSHRQRNSLQEKGGLPVRRGFLTFNPRANKERVAANRFNSDDSGLISPLFYASLILPFMVKGEGFKAAKLKVTSYIFPFTSGGILKSPSPPALDNINMIIL